MAKPSRAFVTLFLVNFAVLAFGMFSPSRACFAAGALSMALDIRTLARVSRMRDRVEDLGVDLPNLSWRLWVRLR